MSFRVEIYLVVIRKKETIPFSPLKSTEAIKSRFIISEEESSVCSSSISHNFVNSMCAKPYLNVLAECKLDTVNRAYCFTTLFFNYICKTKRQLNKNFELEHNTVER